MATALRFVRAAMAGMLPTDVRLFVRRQRYRGSAHTCPLCASRVKRFNDFGVPLDVVSRRQIVGALPVADDICPVCYGASRARLIAFFLENCANLNSSPGLRVLHIAPDIGLFYWLRDKMMAEYVPCDLSPERYSIVPHMRRADLTALPFENKRFDIVICSHVLEHIPNDKAAMREIRRVLSEDGVALLMVPEADDGGGTDEDLSITVPAEREMLYGQWDHVRLYGRSDFSARVQGAGFSVQGFDAFSVDPSIALIWKLNPRERLWVARRC